MHEWDDAERVRGRLADRLHDGPIQELTAAQLFLDGVALRLQAGDVDPAVRESLQRGLEALRGATLACRRLMESLRPGVDGEGELAHRLERLVVDAVPGAQARVDVPTALGRSMPVWALRVYRLAEEFVELLSSRTSRWADIAVVVTDDEAVLAATPVASAAPDDVQRLEAFADAAGGALRMDRSGAGLRVVVPARGGDPAASVSDGRVEGP